MVTTRGRVTLPAAPLTAQIGALPRHRPAVRVTTLKLSFHGCTRSVGHHVFGNYVRN